MNTDAIVNTANPRVAIGAGCDHAVYQAAGRDELLAYRREHIGEVRIMAAEDRARTAMTAQRAASFTSFWELSPCPFWDYT